MEADFDRGFLRSRLATTLLDEYERLRVEHRGHVHHAARPAAADVNLVGLACDLGTPHAGRRVSALGIFVAVNALAKGKPLEERDQLLFHLFPAPCLACGVHVVYVFDGTGLCALDPCEEMERDFRLHMPVPSGVLLFGSQMHQKVHRASRSSWSDLEAEACGGRGPESLLARRRIAAMYAEQVPMIRVRTGYIRESLALLDEGERWTLTRSVSASEGSRHLAEVRCSPSCTALDILDRWSVRSASLDSLHPLTQVPVPPGVYAFTFPSVVHPRLARNQAGEALLSIERVGA